MLALVIFLHKAGDPIELTNYRPISLLNGLNKLIEKLIYKRTLKILENNNVLSNSQFGFHKQLSSEATIHNFTNPIYEALGKGEFSLGYFINLKKAFDSLDRTIIIGKLRHYGFGGHILSWFVSYLSNRRQYASVRGVSSTCKSLNYSSGKCHGFTDFYCLH